MTGRYIFSDMRSDLELFVFSLFSAEVTCLDAGVSCMGAWYELTEYVVGKQDAMDLYV